MLGKVGFGASMVALNAYLPSLAKESPEVVALQDNIRDSSSLDDTTTAAHEVNSATLPAVEEPLLQQSEDAALQRTKYDTVLARAISRISSRGIALGYSAGIILLLLTLIPVTKLHGSTFSLRLAIGLSGIWWFVFSIPAAIWLPGGDNLAATDETATWSDTSDPAVGDVKWNLRREIVAAWKGLGHMLRWREIKKMRNTFIYLAAWCLLSDGQYCVIIFGPGFLIFYIML